MAENKEGQEKSEPASKKKMDDGRLRGQISKSTDVTTSAVILLGGISIFIFGGPFIDNYKSFMGYFLQNSAQIPLSYQNFIDYYPKIIGYIATILLPIVLMIFFIVLASEIGQVGLKVATKKFSEFEDLKKIFKIGSGLKKIFFSSRSLFELAKNFAKIGFLGFIIFWQLYSNFDDIISISEKPFQEIGSFMFLLAMKITMIMGLVYILIAYSDYIFQKWKHKVDMKMTKQEVKDEVKQQDGDPKIKAQFKALIRQRLRKMMVSSVADADVVITNPTHFAVALKYKHGDSTAPIVIAKGIDFIALQIRMKAEEFNVPIVEEPPLARTLYQNVEVNQEIPEDLFKAVAQILAYVYSLK